MNYKKALFISTCALLNASLWAQGAGSDKPHTIDWKLAQLPHIEVTEGTPEKLGTALGETIEFDGTGDAFFLDMNPLEGMENLTLEVIFKPDSTGNFAQRFLHLGTPMGERILFETRTNADGTWYFDAHTSLTNGGKLTLIDEKLLHKTNQWYNVSLVVGNGTLTTYVNGVKQCEGKLEYTPINEGKASIGVRQNKVDWFKGAIYRIRITPKALSATQLLKDYEKLNR